MILKNSINKKRILSHFKSDSIKSSFNKRLYCESKNEINKNPFEPGAYSHAIQYCFESVKTTDYPHYFASMFLNKELKISQLALRSFNIELASIKSSKSYEASKANMDWWKDSIKRIYKGEYIKHPTLLVLREVIHKKKLSQVWFTKIIDARTKDLSVTQPATLDDLVEYSEATASSLLYLALESANIRNIQADHAASHLGKAIGLSTILKAIPYHSIDNQVYIPIDLSVKHKFSAEKFIRREITQEGRNVIYEIANLANENLEFSRKLINDVPEEARPLFLSAEFYGDYLQRLMSTDFDPFHPRLMHYKILTRPKVIYNYLTKKY